MGHIHTGPGEHDLTVSAFIIRETTEGPELLMHQHKNLNRIMQPGGHVELHENPFRAVLREIHEETGYLPDQLCLLQNRNRVGANVVGITDYRVRTDPQPIHVNTHDISNEGSHYHTDLAYGFAVTGKPRGIPLVGESTEFYWLRHRDITNQDNNIPSNVRLIADWLLRNYHEMGTTWVGKYT